VVVPEVEKVQESRARSRALRHRLDDELSKLEALQHTQMANIRAAADALAAETGKPTDVSVEATVKVGRRKPRFWLWTL
jgi:hypothetical protein